MINVALMLAGKGTRMNLDIPKQFIEVNNKEIFEYALTTFDNNPLVDKIFLVINKEDFIHVKEIIDNKEYKHPLEIVFGGATRQESVFNALTKINELGANEGDKVLIHDACRPLLTDKLINKIIETLETEKACVPALKMTDSICLSNSSDYIDKNEDRSKIFALQTPQGFDFNFIFKVHNNARNSELNYFTDDTSLVIINGGKVKLIEGEKFNFKITTFDDLFLFKNLVRG